MQLTWRFLVLIAGLLAAVAATALASLSAMKNLDAALARMVDDDTPRLLANAITLGVNRPHYVEGAAWRALVPDSVRTDLDGLLTELRAELTAGGRRAALRYDQVAIDAIGGQARLVWDQIRMLLWPGWPSDLADWRFVADFRRHAMAFYDPTDARRYHRERRFATLELLPW